MVLKIPAELKKVTPFVRRAEELDRDKQNPESRLVAYYSRQYAVSVGIPLATSAEGKACLGSLLEDLEKEKVPMSNFTRAEAKFVCRKFAMGVFDKADGEDRLGMANKNTAKTFYAAATFFDILQQFYEDDDESEEREEEKKKTVYSKWKATEILKAIKAGKQPTPGGYGETNEEEGDQPEETKSEEEEAEPEETNVADLPPPPVPVLPPVLPPPPVEVETVTEDDDISEQGTEVGLDGPPPPAYGTVSPPKDDTPPPASIDRPPIKPVYKPPVPAPPVVPSPTKKASSFFRRSKPSENKSKVSKKELADAVELTKFALSALQSKDVDVAASRLKEALKALGH